MKLKFSEARSRAHTEHDSVNVIKLIENLVTWPITIFPGYLLNESDVKSNVNAMSQAEAGENSSKHMQFLMTLWFIKHRKSSPLNNMKNDKALRLMVQLGRVWKWGSLEKL